MPAELVRITCRDGVQLDGAILRPNAPRALGLDAVCLVHGTGGNFYSSSLFDHFAERFLKLGLAVLRVNTRGHDGISTAVTERGGVRLGAAYETVDDCRHDLVGWMDWLRSNVGPRVLLAGHSVGAVKSLYAAAHEPALAPQGILALSPPRLSYSWFCQSAQAQEFLAAFEKAEALIAAGEGKTLIDVMLPLPMAIAAAGYVEKYGPSERYNYLNFTPAVKCPTHFLFGSVEVEKNMAIAEVPAEVERLAEKHIHLSVDIVPGGDHFYSGVRDAAWERIEAWLRRVFSD
ncbi:MAG: alpha/beta fold hydrolase [Gemmataceae bacterium]|nr:alpha/beta fold hydrolase [Gemmataceae bacterium]MCI0742707.1 alpha/beta fold hydrolase [Gemmataceae bacterium]